MVLNYWFLPLFLFVLFLFVCFVVVFGLFILFFIIFCIMMKCYFQCRKNSKDPMTYTRMEFSNDKSQVTINFDSGNKGIHYQSLDRDDP